MNVNRRNLTKGQRALAAAQMRQFSKNESGQVSAAHSAEVSSGYVAMADVVIQHLPELADAVMAGTIPLNDAYAEAKQHKEASELRHFSVGGRCHKLPVLNGPEESVN